jgi:hypothetical protein
VLDEIAAAQNLTSDQQRERLANLAGALEQVATEESVAAMSRRLGQLLGTTSRAAAPAEEPVAGDFDFETAQLHDVKRTANAERGGYQYVGVLLDSHGRTLETPLETADGENLYATMELIKSNPLLERIYRGLVMSLMDKLLQGARE